MRLPSADFESAFSTVAGDCKWAHVDHITSYKSVTCTVSAFRIALQTEALDTGAKYHQKYPRKFAEKVSDGERAASDLRSDMVPKLDPIRL